MKRPRQIFRVKSIFRQSHVLKVIYYHFCWKSKLIFCCLANPINSLVLKFTHWLTLFRMKS